MPIAIDTLDSSVEVDAPASGSETPAAEPRIEALMRFQQLARRQEALGARTSAWNFDD